MTPLSDDPERLARMKSEAERYKPVVIKPDDPPMVYSTPNETMKAWILNNGVLFIVDPS